MIVSGGGYTLPVSPVSRFYYTNSILAMHRCKKVGGAGRCVREGREQVRLPQTLDDVVAAYGKVRNRSRKSVALAASPSHGLTPKISSRVRSVELCV